MRTLTAAVRWLSLPAAALSAGLIVAVLSAQEQPPEGKSDTKPAPAETTPDEPKSDAPKSDAPKSDTPTTDAPKPARETSPPAVSDSGEAVAAFQAKMTEWKTLLKDLRSIGAKYGTAGEAEMPALQKQWDDLVAKGNAMIPELRSTGLAAYKASPNTDRDLAGFLAKVADDEIKRDQYEQALELARTLIDNEYDRTEVYATAGIASFALDDFDSAEQYFDKAKEYLSSAHEHDPIAELAQSIIPHVGEYKELWKREQELRAKEEAADDLPRVKLTTDEGEIVVELFENEAPQTVGNFVSLVESKLYDGTVFHRVLPNFMAQGGSPDGTGGGGPGYRIPCECYTDDARMHFRGSLSMAHAGKDTGGSQFFLTFLPTPHLNRVMAPEQKGHTVFGRVIEGFDVLAKIHRRNPGPDPKTGLPVPESSLPMPTKLIKAEVIRKRDHEYKPTRIE